MANSATITQKFDFYTSFFKDVKITRDEKNFEVTCPICNPDDKKKKKLCISVENEICHCWVCGWKSRSLFPIIRKFGSTSQIEKYKSISNSLILTGDVGTEVKEVVSLPKDFKHVNDAVLPDEIAVRNYCYNVRNIERSAAWKFCLGFSSELNRRLIFPSFDKSGNCNYYTARAIDENTFDKYKNPILEKSNEIFNDIHIDWKKPITLVEGPIDAVMCPPNTLPVLGSEIDEMHATFIKLLENASDVTIYFDRDAQFKAMKVANKLAFYNMHVKIVHSWNMDHSDPGSTSVETNSKCIEEAKQFSWIDHMKLKIEKNTKTRRIFL